MCRAECTSAQTWVDVRGSNDTVHVGACCRTMHSQSLLHRVAPHPPSAGQHAPACGQPLHQHGVQPSDLAQVARAWAQALPCSAQPLLVVKQRNSAGVKDRHAALAALHAQCLPCHDPQAAQSYTLLVLVCAHRARSHVMQHTLVQSFIEYRTQPDTAPL